MSDEFFGVLQRRVVGGDLNLCENRHHVARISCFAQCVLERLLQHVPDPASSAGDEYTKRKRRDLAARLLIPDKLVADLRSIAVNYHDPPAIESKIDNGTEAFAGVPELIGDCRSLPRRRQRVTTNRNDR